MDNINCFECNFPVIQPSDIWDESGRLNTFIPPLAKFTDRRDKQMIIAPTHEESALSMVRGSVNSYRDLPFSIFQIQTKFRDETRPRGGLLRVREFEMKDAYSFHGDDNDLDKAYKQFSQAYFNIFNRCGVEVIKVQADSGAIGGKDSAEFILVAESGEDTILKCDGCGYAANEEKAQFKKEIKESSKDKTEITKVETKGIKTIKQLEDFFSINSSNFLKTVVYIVDEQPVFVVLAGDLEVNDTKVRNLLGTDIRTAEINDFEKFNILQGYTSPYLKNFKTIIDDSVNLDASYIAGSNTENFHIDNLIPNRDISFEHYIDVAKAKPGAFSLTCSVSNDCKGLEQVKGIEVGHIFKLRDAYSSKMGLNFLDSTGNQSNVLMGCYGIGVGRLLAAIIESNSDEKGMKFVKDVAPFEIYLANLNTDNEEVKKRAIGIYEEMKLAGIDVIFDDRDESPGVKFKDFELIGTPIRVVISKRSLSSDEVEIKERNNENMMMVPIDNVVIKLKEMMQI
jgi:prolyl-tRNA synthetase